MRRRQRRPRAIQDRPYAGSVVYVVGPESGPVKIGWASHFAPRLLALRAGSPVPLAIWLTIRGDWALERELHDRFVRYRLHGEWFELGDALEAFLRLNRYRRDDQRTEREVWQSSEPLIWPGQHSMSPDPAPQRPTALPNLPAQNVRHCIGGCGRLVGRGLPFCPSCAEQLRAQFRNPT